MAGSPHPNLVAGRRSRVAPGADLVVTKTAERAAELSAPVRPKAPIAAVLADTPEPGRPAATREHLVLVRRPVPVRPVLERPLAATQAPVPDRVRAVPNLGRRAQAPDRVRAAPNLGRQARRVPDRVLRPQAAPNRGRQARLALVRVSQAPNLERRERVLDRVLRAVPNREQRVLDRAPQRRAVPKRKPGSRRAPDLRQERVALLGRLLPPPGHLVGILVEYRGMELDCPDCCRSWVPSLRRRRVLKSILRHSDKSGIAHEMKPGRYQPSRSLSRYSH